MSSTPQSSSPQARKLINVIPVGLKEAALDSPSFRASTAYFFEQIDTIERWLDGYVKATTRLSAEVSALEGVSNSLLSHITSPFIVSESVLDNDYATLALKRYGDSARDFWSGVLSTLKKTETVVADPIRTFLNGDLRALKEVRRILDHTQKQYDHLQARYASQAKTKEPSSLREDAFQLHEARKAYLRASMDFCVQTPQIKATLEKLLIHVFYNQWREFKVIRDNSSSTFAKFGPEMERIKGWTREVENTEQYSRRELHAARKEIEDAAELAVRPSRELEDYSISTVPFLGSQGPASVDRPFGPEKQGWVSLRVFTGKPTRTIWVRRWAFLRNGIFGCLVQGSRTGGVEESERIGVLLCSIRPAFQEERRFCFEVKTKSNSIMLQAETQKELTEWIGAFESAKRKALESPKTDFTAVGNAPAQDPAFAISQPPVPEFAADPSESLNPGDDHTTADRTPTLSVVDRDGLGVRNSGDFATMRRSTAVDRETDGSRDHASRIKHKLDLHRRPNHSPQQGLGLSPHPGSGGSSNAALPPASGTSIELDPKEKLQPSYTPRGGVSSAALAPPNLVNPPNPTSMSNAAVTVTYERGIGSGLSDGTGAVIPTGIMANSWGSTHWGLVNRFQFDSRQSGYMEEGSNDPTQAPVLSENDRPEASPSQRRSPVSRHRPTASLGDTPSTRGETAVPPPDYPASYPQSLKLHDAQFRLLFPEVPRDESLVFVFRATFSPNEQQDFPGRAFATTRNLYFYSNYSGLILASCVCLNNISEVTAAPGRDCDFLFLHVIADEGSDVPRRVTVKTFLDPLKFLRKRLNFLVSNASSDQPGDLESVIKSLVKMESDGPTRTSSFQGWDDNILTPVDERTENIEPFANKQENRSQSQVYVDKDLRLDPNKASQQAEASKFKLPSQAVEYVPQGAPHLGAERTFDVTPKVLFHLLFGDKSSIWQQLQLQRTVQDIKRGPWTNLQSGHRTRKFEYRIEVPDLFGNRHLIDVSDYQIVDVLNEHLCYVVTDKRTPWHLPFRRNFRLVSKIVVTHVAKSRCKLAVFTKVEWIRQPYIVGGIIDKEAVKDLDQDALDLVDLVAEQVRKLGPQPQSKMAISMFGHLGREREAVQVAGDGASLRPNRRPPKPSGLTPLLLENSGSFLQSAISSLMMWLWGVLRWVFKASNANRVVVLILCLSLGLNGLHSYNHAVEIWNERRAGDFMNRLGLGPHGVLSKAVYIRDLDDAIAPTTTEMEAQNSSTCFSVFRDNNDLGSSGVMPPPTPAVHDSGTKPASFRLQRTRQHLSTYRHDLLVALRLVNRVEKEVLQAEWERWVLQESRRCKALESVLNDQSGESHNAGDDDNDDDSDSHRFKKQFAGRADIEQWYKEYCLSCQQQQKQLVNSEDTVL